MDMWMFYWSGCRCQKVPRKWGSTNKTYYLSSPTLQVVSLGERHIFSRILGPAVCQCICAEGGLDQRIKPTAMGGLKISKQVDLGFPVSLPYQLYHGVSIPSGALLSSSGTWTACINLNSNLLSQDRGCCGIHRCEIDTHELGRLLGELNRIAESDPNEPTRWAILCKISNDINRQY